MHLVISALEQRIHKLSKKIKVFHEIYPAQTKIPTCLSRYILAETVFLVFKAHTAFFNVPSFYLLHSIYKMIILSRQIV